ncbi:MAG: T9SS type A sorting domain-containing protein [Flavobacteriales bacterium]|nr:T9SS type A sorting domain-containing protein [Flavobacteriales bacterium]HRH68042.1 hypothetical protein [Flavobacteriales bacterium]
MAHTIPHPTKYILLLIGATTIAPQLLAQGLGQQDLLPPIGSTWHMRALQTVPTEELPVEPIVWSYSQLVGNDVFGASYAVVSPQQVPGSSAFPDADRVLRTMPDNEPSRTHTFYNVQSDQCVELGSTSSLQSTTFTQPGLVYAYPLGQDQVINGNFCYTTTSSSSITDYCGTTRISLDATGTLELSFGTFQNVQLVTTRRATLLMNVEGEEDSTILVLKDWYAQGIPYPLLHTSALTLPDGSTTRLGQVLDPTSVVGIDEVRTASVLAAYPNPSSGVVVLNTDGLAGTLSITGVDGRLVRTERIAGSQPTTSLDLTDLPDGAYHLALRGVGTLRAAVVVVAH